MLCFSHDASLSLQILTFCRHFGFDLARISPLATRFSSLFRHLLSLAHRLSSLLPPPSSLVRRPSSSVFRLSSPPLSSHPRLYPVGYRSSLIVGCLLLAHASAKSLVAHRSYSAACCSCTPLLSCLSLIAHRQLLVSRPILLLLQPSKFFVSVCVCVCAVSSVW